MGEEFANRSYRSPPRRKHINFLIRLFYCCGYASFGVLITINRRMLRNHWDKFNSFNGHRLMPIITSRDDNDNYQQQQGRPFADNNDSGTHYHIRVAVLHTHYV